VRFSWAFALLLAAACGEIPRPFAGDRPTAEEALLRRPPPARIIVPPQLEASLSVTGAQRFADALAESLREQELPATAAPTARPGSRDWRVNATFERAGPSIALSYALVDEKGERVGTVRAPRPVSYAAWEEADPATISAAAADAGPAIAALTGRADQARRAAGPTGPARLPTVAVLQVSGAPGDGNIALTVAMREAVGRRGLILQEEASGADYVVAGTVETDPRPGGQLYVEIAWRVTQGRLELGKVSQLNEVPARAIAGRWGDVAYVVAEEASGGVRQVLDNARESQGRASAANQRAAEPPRPTPPGGLSGLSEPVIPAAAAAPAPRPIAPARPRR
jgi:hypothetical protein